MSMKGSDFMLGRWPEEKRKPLAKLRGSLTIEKAAVAMEITGRTLSRYENGTADVPMKIADKMVKLYGVSIETIYHALQETWAKSAEHADDAKNVVQERLESKLVDELQFTQKLQQAPAEYISVTDAAKKLHLPRDCMYIACKQGHLPNMRKSGEDWLIPIEALQIVESISDAERAGG